MAVRVDLLEESFDLVVLRGDDLTNSFYRRVLSHPSLAPLFAGVAMDVQKLKFLSTLVALRSAWRQWETIGPELEALGARHISYGVLEEHYPILGTALLDALAEVAGAAWTPEYSASWREAYTVVQEAMVRGAARMGSQARRQEV